MNLKISVLYIAKYSWIPFTVLTVLFSFLILISENPLNLYNSFRISFIFMVVQFITGHIVLNIVDDTFN